jgi:hypothetical protein
MSRVQYVLAFLLITGSAWAQDRPSASASVKPKEPTVADLKFEVAQKDVEIAQLKMRLLQCQVPAAYKQAADDIAQAQKEVQDSTPKQQDPTKHSGPHSDTSPKGNHGNDRP